MIDQWETTEGFRLTTASPFAQPLSMYASATFSRSKRNTLSSTGRMAPQKKRVALKQRASMTSLIVKGGWESRSEG
jgi:hypothetical protein